jgi:hypothetical protein
MPPAVIAAGAVAAGTIGGAVIGSSAQKKAANQANAAQQRSTDAQLQLGRENINFQQGIYNQNRGLLSPFVERGNVAGQSINALLGLPSAPSSSAPTGVQTAPVAGQVAVNDPAWSEGALQAMGLGSRGDSVGTLQGHLGGQIEGQLPDYVRQRYDSYVQSHPQQQQQQQTTAAPTGTQPLDAFNNFANSAGMQFQLQQGENAINNGYAAKGQLQSGAALKGLQNYGQQTALNNYFLPYLGLLGGQQATGAQAGSAIAGVGSNFGNTVANIYGQQGNAIQSGANAASNAALLRGQANNNMWSGIASGLGTFASSFAPPKGF